MIRKIITIKDKKIGDGNPSFIVAEISGNHRQRFEEAVKLIHAAKDSGADAVKLQTYTPDTITLNSNRKWFEVGGTENPKEWRKKTLYELYQEAFTPWDWQPKLKQIADKIGITLFSSPFDETAVDFLEKMNVPCYKIASYEVVDIPLIKKVAQTKKPVIMSVGFASFKEIGLAVDTLKKYGSGQLCLLHCVTEYAHEPSIDSMNLQTIDALREKFGVLSGFSDNNAGIEIPIIAAVLGASVVEKHLTLKRLRGGPDYKFSLEPAEFTEMVNRIREAEKAIGSAHFGPANSSERYNRRFRPSIFVSSDIKKGERFSAQNIKTVRPDNGLAPKNWYKVIGKKAKRDIAFGTPLSWNLIEK